MYKNSILTVKHKDKVGIFRLQLMIFLQLLIKKIKVFTAFYQLLK